MISYPIEAAKNSGLFSRIIVSTDSEKIAAISKECGAEVPFMRPSALADDFTGTADVVLHSIDYLHKEGAKPKYVCCIYPATPLMTPSHLREGYRLITERHADSVYPLIPFPHPVFHALKITAEGTISPVWQEHQNNRSNDYPQFYHDAGQFYWLSVSSFLQSKDCLMKNSLPIVLKQSEVVDIDTMEDWELAEQIFVNAKN